MHGAPAYGGDAHRRSGCSRGRAEVRSGGHTRATLAAQPVSGRTRTGIFGVPWRTGCPQAGPRGKSEPDREVQNTLRTVSFRAHRGLDEHHVVNRGLS